MILYLSVNLRSILATGSLKIIIKYSSMHVTQPLIGQYSCLDQAVQTREFKSTFKFIL